MSVFKCATTYKKSKYSRQSVKNQLVAHKFIDDKFTILDLNSFRRANTELSNDASEKLGRKVRLFAEENGGKRALPYEELFREIDRKELQIQSLIEKAQTTGFDKQLAQKIQDKLQKLYPEIKLNITNNPVWEQGDNVFNQEEFNNEVNFRLKVVDSLIKLTESKETKRTRKYDEITKPEKLTIRLSTKERPYLTENLIKTLSNKGVPKNQIQFVIDYMESNNLKEISTDELALRLANNYSYTIEINTAKEKTQDYDMIDLTGEGDFEPREFIPDTEYIEEYDEDGNIIGIKEVLSEKGKKQIEERENKRKPTQYYSNLTVPGGTNYTENEIATPNITPSIKGHAQFATDKGIGWFRSDDYRSTKEADDIFSEGIYTKTRRILEVQSDLFQKGRDKNLLIDSPIQRSENTEFGENRYIDQEENGNYVIVTNYIDKQEISKEFATIEEAQKELNNLTNKQGKEVQSSTQNQFLQLLNKDNNWVTFFVKSIIQDSAKKGYAKVLFPSGKTASKVEGHTTLEEFKKQKEDRIKELEHDLKNTKQTDLMPDISLSDFQNDLKNEINQIKQELERVETEGFGALKPIFNFYENTVQNILKKQGYNPVLITDEYGNTWNELTINQARDLANIMLQRNEANQIIGQANIKAMTVLIDAINQKQDTLPHEYAHHYIAWYRNTPIVQEAIKKWGSEEALVQSIGEQAVTQKGEAWEWWKKFVKWLLGDLNKLSRLDKESLTKILTDAFLTRQNLETLGGASDLSKPVSSKQLAEKVFSVSINTPEQFKQYAAQNKDKLLILESTPDMTTVSVPGIGSVEGLSLDNVMTISTIGATKQDIKNSFEDLDIELRADGTIDVIFVNQDYGSSLKNSDLESYNLLNSLLKNNFNFNNTNANSIEVAENNQAQVDYQLSIDFSEVADVMNNLTCK